MNRYPSREVLRRARLVLMVISVQALGACAVLFAPPPGVIVPLRPNMDESPPLELVIEKRTVVEIELGFESRSSTISPESVIDNRRNYGNFAADPCGVSKIETPIKIALTAEDEVASGGSLSFSSIPRMRSSSWPVRRFVAGVTLNPGRYLIGVDISGFNPLAWNYDVRLHLMPVGLLIRPLTREGPNVAYPSKLLRSETCQD